MHGAHASENPHKLQTIKLEGPRTLYPFVLLHGSKYDMTKVHMSISSTML